MPRAWAVVPAAGSGQRLGGTVAKQYLPLAGRSMLAHAIAPFLACGQIEAVVLVVSPGDMRWRETLPQQDRILTTAGGVERCHSVRNGLERLAGRAADDDWVLVHDAARPCVSGEEIQALFVALADDPVGGLLALPLADTLKAQDEGGRVARTIPREGLWRALTPQMFRYGVLTQALDAAIAAGHAVTDEAAAIELAGLRPMLVPGRPGNMKITSADDLVLAEAVLSRRMEGECA